MERDFMTIANSPIMWLAACVPVIIVLIQCVIYLRSSLKTGKEMGIPSTKLNAAIRSTAVAGIGPGLANLAGVVTLVTAIGAPIAWMRLSIIGAVTYEMGAAKIGAAAMGVELGGVGYGAEAFAASVWAMCMGTTIYVLFPCLFAKRFDQLFQKIVKGNNAKMGVLSAGCSAGVFAYLISSYPVTGVKTGNWVPFAATIGGCLAYFVLTTIKNKTGKSWIGVWSLTIAMFFGLLMAVLVGLINPA